MRGDVTLSSDPRDEKLTRMLTPFCQLRYSLNVVDWPAPIRSLSPLCCRRRTKAWILWSATSTVWSSIFAKQILKKPGSVQQKEDPGDKLIFTSSNITLQSCISASKVICCSLRSGRKSIQKKRPALLSRQLIPTWASPSLKRVYLLDIDHLFISQTINIIAACKKNAWMPTKKKVS